MIHTKDAFSKIISTNHAKNIYEYGDKRLNQMNFNATILKTWWDQNSTPEYALTNWKNKPVRKRVQVNLLIFMSISLLYTQTF
jgi:hypothetical protein